MATAPVVIPTAPAQALERNPELRLSDPEMRPTMEALRRKIIDDPSFGRQLLRDAGIINSKGKLAKSFGG